MIQRGQIYRSATAVEGPDGVSTFVRIQVTEGPGRHDFAAGSVRVGTLVEENSAPRLVRQRWLLASQLHDSPVTKTGATRRTGWILVEGADGGNADA